MSDSGNEVLEKEEKVRKKAERDVIATVLTPNNPKFPKPYLCKKSKLFLSGFDSHKPETITQNG